MSDLFAWEGDQPSRRLVTRCALARVCGACGEPLGRPIAFVGDEDEVGRNAFHAPPMHRRCADRALGSVRPGGHVVETSGFEFVRPTATDLDQAVRFVPNSLIT